MTPRSTSPQRQPACSRVGSTSTGKRRAASKRAKASRMARPERGRHPRPRHVASQGSNTCSTRRRADRVALVGDAAPVRAVLDGGGPPATTKLDEPGDALEHVDRLEPGDNAWDGELVHQKAIRGEPRDGGDVAGEDEAVRWRSRGSLAMARSAAGVVLCTQKTEKLASSRAGRLEDARRDGGRGGLKAHTHEDDLALGVCRRKLHGVERRVGPRVRPRRRPSRRRAKRLEPGTRIISPKVAMMGARHSRERDGGGRCRVGGHADRAPRAGEQMQPAGRSGAEAVAPDAHGVGAADLHKVDLAVAQGLADMVEKRADEVRVAKGGRGRGHPSPRPPRRRAQRRSWHPCRRAPRASSSSRSRRTSMVSRACSASMTSMAKPACTSTKSPTLASGVRRTETLRVAPHHVDGRLRIIAHLENLAGNGEAHSSSFFEAQRTLLHAALVPRLDWDGWYRRR